MESTPLPGNEQIKVLIFLCISLVLCFVIVGIPACFCYFAWHVCYAEKS